MGYFSEQAFEAMHSDIKVKSGIYSLILLWSYRYCGRESKFLLAIQIMGIRWDLSLWPIMPDTCKFVNFVNFVHGDRFIWILLLYHPIQTRFFLISQEPRNGFPYHFFLVKTEIHSHILNIEPFLCNCKWLRWKQNKTNHSIKS